MPRRSLFPISKSRVDALKAGSQMWDSQVVGFGIVANAHSKSYKLKYRFKGTQRMLTIGMHGSPWTVDMARKKAIDYLAQLNSGVDPAAEKINHSLTVAELADEYMAKHALVQKKASSATQDKANLKNHIKPILGKLAVAYVTPREIDDFKVKVESGKTAPNNPKAVQKAQKGGSPVKGGKGVTNRCLALLSKMFNLAERWGYRPQHTNPTVGISKYPEKAKERFLTEDELKRLWGHLDDMAAADDANEHVVAFFRLLILTGARSSEIRDLKWAHVDLVGKRLNLPDSKTGSKTIQLANTAIEILEALPRVKGNDYVIVGGKTGRPLRNVRKPWVAIRSAIGLTDVRIHDLRHSFASFAAAQGTPLTTIGALMGHRNVSTTAKYAHLSSGYLQQANNALGQHVLGIVNGPGPNAHPPGSQSQISGQQLQPSGQQSANPNVFDTIVEN